MKPGDKPPPLNLGPYDNPLLWNILDPYGADRAHQRRPLSVSRTMMEMHLVPTIYRDHCVHRYLPLMKCMKNLRPMTFGVDHCLEFLEAWFECRTFEKVRGQQLKQKFIELTKDYTTEEKHFFPDIQFCTVPYTLHSYFWLAAASGRLCGWDEKDPANPMWWREPNRAMMRTEFMPTNFEKKLATSALGCKILPPDIVETELPVFPLPEERRPKSPYFTDG